MLYTPGLGGDRLTSILTSRAIVLLVGVPKDLGFRLVIFAESDEEDTIFYLTSQ